MEMTLHVNEDELRMLREAMRAYVGDFGIEQLDVLRPAKALLARIEHLSAPGALPTDQPTVLPH